MTLNLFLSGTSRKREDRRPRKKIKVNDTHVSYLIYPDFYPQMFLEVPDKQIKFKVIST